MLQMDIKDGFIPATFPMHLWRDQASRYDAYWAWHTGEILEEIVGHTKEGEPVYRYPLKINPVRDFARKHAALLFGEVPDTPTPLVKTLIAPKTIYGNSSKSMKEQGEFLSDFVTEVWMSSNGRSIQYENGEISQFLGGSVFQVQYVPWRKDLLIPIQIKNIYPNYFLPIWGADNYYDLLEAWVIYRVDPAVAHAQWGIDTGGLRPAIYVEHWTKDYYEASINGKPLEASYDGVRVSYDRQENPFGFVPFVYIPRVREGSYYGSSLVPDIAGLALEFNSRAADEGDAMRRTVHQKYWGRNIHGDIKERRLDAAGNTFLDLGPTNPVWESDPTIEPLDPPEWDPSYSKHKEFLWGQLMREANLGPIAFGEDEGSQRSALTLAFRMWPSTIIAKAQRTFWTDGLIQVARYVLLMAAIKGIEVDSQRVPADFDKKFSITPQWLPMIPRDREALVNEMILRLQAGAVPIEKALEAFADVPDIQEAMQQIMRWLIFNTQLAAAGKTQEGGAGSGAPTQMVSPIAMSGLIEGKPE